jgi:hypothetical protein
MLVLSFTMCGFLGYAGAQDPRAQAWIHQMVDLRQHAYAQQYLFDAGYRADQARDYDTAFDKLSGFSRANHDRLQAARSPGERAFGDWLKSELKALEEIRKQKSREDGADEARRSNARNGTRQEPSSTVGANSTSPPGSQGGGASQGPSFNAGANSDSKLLSRPQTVESLGHLSQSGSQSGGTRQGPGSSSFTRPDSNISFGSKAGPRIVEMPNPDRLNNSASQGGGTRQRTSFNPTSHQSIYQRHIAPFVAHTRH